MYIMVIKERKVLHAKDEKMVKKKKGENSMEIFG